MLLHRPVDGLAGVAVTLVIPLTGAVDDQSRLVAVCVLVTAAVVLGAEVWSCRVLNKTNLTPRIVNVPPSDLHLIIMQYVEEHLHLRELHFLPNLSLKRLKVFI